MEPETIVFGGGGVRVIAYQGALEILDRAHMLHNVTNFYGVSAGAMIATLLGAKYSISELGKLLHDFDFSSLQDITVDGLLNIQETFGVDEGNKMKQSIGRFLEERGIPAAVTFTEYATITGSQLHMFATNLNKIVPIHFSTTTTPNVRVIDALRASMAVPGWLTPVLFPDEKCVLIDGGMYNNYPFEYVPVHERQKTIGIAFAPEASMCTTIRNVGEYLEQIVACATHPRATKAIRRFRDKTIVIDIDKFPPFKLDLTVEEKLWLAECGKRAAIEYIRKIEGALNIE